MRFFITTAICFFLGVGSVFSQQKVTVPVAEIGRSVSLIGQLGEPLHTMMTIQGTWHFPTEVTKDGSIRFYVSHVNQKKLVKPVVYYVAEVSVMLKGGNNAIPKWEDQRQIDGQTWLLRAYESISMRGIPYEFLKESGQFPSATRYAPGVLESEIHGVLIKTSAQIKSK